MAQAKEQKNSTMSDREFYFLMGVVALILLILFLTKHGERILFSVYQHFDKIGMGIYGLFALGIFILKEKMKKNLPKDRVYHLSKVWSDEAGTFIATTKDGTRIHLPDKTRTGHVQIIGATGRGKTESVILPMMVRDLRRGKSCVLIDGKGDVELAERIKKQAPHVEVITFNLGDLTNSAITNPLKVGTSQQITDRIFTSFDFKDEYYRNTQYEITSALVALLCEQREEVTFKKLYDLFTSDELLSVAVSKCHDEVLTTRLVKWLSENRAKRDENNSGIISQLGQLARGEVSHLVNGGEKAFSLGELMAGTQDKQFAVIILIPTLLYQEMAFKLGKLFLQEIAWAVAARKEKTFTPVFLDEFSSFVYEGFIGILNKARSSGKETEIGVVFSLTKLGLTLLQAKTPDRITRIEPVPVNTSTLYHDLLLVDVTKKLESIFPGMGFVSGKLLGLPSQKIKRIPDIIEHGRETEKLMAIELELTAKSEKRYRQILTEYRIAQEFERILYMTSHVSIEEKIRSLLTHKKVDGFARPSTGKFYFSALNNFFKDTNNLTLTNGTENLCPAKETLYA